MPNIFDYLEWRGDLTLDQAPLNEVDNLIFCLLSYVDLDGIVPGDGAKGCIPLRQAAAEYFFAHGDTLSDRPLGLIVPADILTLFRRMGKCRRSRDLEMTGYVNAVSEEREMQFSAVTIRLPAEQIFVAFRGTDDTLVGWREDFNLSHMEEIPSQRMAAQYLDSLDLPPDTALYVGGHSKGGNLAVWGAVHAGQAVRDRIAQVYSNDGPGFSEGTVASEAYQALSDRIRVILPEDSLVGLLLEHDEGYTIVKSNRRGLYQHDGLSWEVLGSSFLRAEGLSPKGLRHDTVVRDRIAAMTREERKRFTHLMFSLLESTGAKTLTDLHRGGTKTLVTMIKAYRELSDREQETAAYLWDKLFTPRADDRLDRAERPDRTEGGLQPTQPKRNKKTGRTRRKGKIRLSWFPLFSV